MKRKTGKRDSLVISARKEFETLIDHTDARHEPLGNVSSDEFDAAANRHMEAGVPYTPDMTFTGCGWWWCVKGDSVDKARWAELVKAARILRSENVSAWDPRVTDLALYCSAEAEIGKSKADYDRIVTTIEGLAMQMETYSGRAACDSIVRSTEFKFAILGREKANKIRPARDHRSRDTHFDHALSTGVAFGWSAAVIAAALFLGQVETPSFAALRTNMRQRWKRRYATKRKGRKDKK